MTKITFNNAFTQCLTVAHGHLERYKTDIAIDNESFNEMAAAGGAPFLYVCRLAGTHLQKLSTQGYPKAGERIPYLFGTSTREEILNGEAGMIDNIRKTFGEQEVLILYYDGETLRRVMMDEAHHIAQTFKANTLAAWENEGKHVTT
jgi:hypothetical protein